MARSAASQRRRHLIIACAAMAGLSACAPNRASGETAPLVLERTIPLPGVMGRIDHMALDTEHGRLFVAALGNGTVEAVDLAAGHVADRIAGLPEPQGVALVPVRGELVVASGGDGSVRFYRASDLAPVGQLSLGEDADNVRFDPGSGRIVVGYGAGALAVIDPGSRAVVGKVGLPAHPEGFQLDGTLAYVNLPDAGRVGVADLGAGRLVATWPTRGRHANYPRAIAPASAEAGVVYRLPARLVVFDLRTGAEKQALETCGDADDLFFDPRRPRIYVTCGDGHVDVFVHAAASWGRLARVASASGARTSLFDAGGDRLYVAARADRGRPAAILVYRPQ